MAQRPGTAPDPTAAPHQWRLGHRPALDGLRGLAIACVVAAHTGAPGLGPLGGAGVTVFFVLSGFLITALLRAEYVASGRIRLGAFYVRRMRRLLPALFALILVVISVSPLLGSWWFEWSDLPPALLFYGNWVEAYSATPGVTLGALSITWSLAIEEQFYLVWPALLLMVRRGRGLFVLVLALAAASLAIRLVPLTGGAARIYYGSDAAAFALLIGAAAAVARMEFSAGRSARWLVVPAAAVVAWYCTWPDVLLVNPGLAVVALAGVAAVWACTGSQPVPVVEQPVLRWLGSRSYGLYLWHGPLLGAMREYFHLPWVVIAVVGIPASLVLAELSYRFVESPWRASPAVRMPVNDPALGGP